MRSVFSNICTIAATACLVAFISGSANAGQLFPPDDAPRSGTGVSQQLRCSNSMPSTPGPIPGQPLLQGGLVAWDVLGNRVSCVDPYKLATSDPSRSCAAGQFMVGIQQGIPVCVSLPNYSCPEGNVLKAVTPTTYSCVPAGGGSGGPITPRTCDDGQFVAGVEANGNVICRSYNPTNGPSPVPSCANGQYLGYANGALGCISPPDSIANVGACAEGRYLAGIMNGQKVCRDFPACPEGQALRGINVQNGQPVCVAVPASASGPTLVGGVDVVVEDGSGRFAYCRLAWGAASCTNPVPNAGQTPGVVCSRGIKRVTTMSHDDIGAPEDQTPGKWLSAGRRGAHVSHFSCIQQ